MLLSVMRLHTHAKSGQKDPLVAILQTQYLPFISPEFCLQFGAFFFAALCICESQRYALFELASILLNKTFREPFLFLVAS